MFVPKTKDDIVKATLSGSLKQIADTVGVATIVMSVSFSVYEITDDTYIKSLQAGIEPASRNK
jgi:hypothetical protein